MASLKAIRRRIASAKSTQQITRALKLVSAARLRRAQEALVNALPYSEALARIADSLLTSEGISVGPVEGAQKRSLLVGVALSRIDNFPRLATIALARDIAAKMLADYSSGAIDEAGIVYTHFQSAIVQKPVYERLLPVKPPGDAGIKPGAEVEAAVSASDKPKIDYLVEPSREELVPVVLRGYLEASVYHALLESEASEQGARMTAMDAATNNADDMISSLTLAMNRARQAQITRELMDIVGGAEALRG